MKKEKRKTKRFVQPTMQTIKLLTRTNRSSWSSRRCYREFYRSSKHPFATDPLSLGAQNRSPLQYPSLPRCASPDHRSCRSASDLPARRRWTAPPQSDPSNEVGSCSPWPSTPSRELVWIPDSPLLHWFEYNMTRPQSRSNCSITWYSGKPGSHLRHLQNIYQVRQKTLVKYFKRVLKRHRLIPLLIFCKSAGSRHVSNVI